MFRHLLLILVAATPVFADEPTNPKVKEYEATLEILRVQTTKGIQRVEDVFNEESSKLKEKLVELLKVELDELLKQKDLDGSVELRDGIKELEGYTPKLNDEKDAAATRKFDHSLVKSFDSRIKLLCLQASRAISRMESGFREEANKLRDELAKSLMGDVDVAMEAKDLEAALALRDLAKEIQGSDPKLDPAPAPVPEEERGPIDLLSQVDVDARKLVGSWERVGNGIIGTGTMEPSQLAILEVPFASRRMFSIEFDLQRVSANRNGFLVRIPVGNGSFKFFVDQAWNSVPFTGIDTQDRDLIRVKGPVTNQGQLATIRCEVRSDSIVVMVDGKEIVSWAGDPTQLTTRTFSHRPEDPSVPRYTLPNQGSIYVCASHDVSYVISRIELFPSSDPKPEPAKDSKTVNLLGIVDPLRDAVRGRFRMKGKVLVHEDLTGGTPQEQRHLLEIPFEPPEEYDLRLVVVNGEGRHLNLTLPAGDSRSLLVLMCMRNWSVYGSTGSRLVLSEDPVKREERSIAARPPAVFLDAMRPHEILCKVRKNSVAVYLDGQSIIEYRGNTAYTGHSEWNPPNPKAIGISCLKLRFEILELELTSVSGKGRLIRP